MKTGFETKTANDPANNQPVLPPPTVEEIAKIFPQLEVIELLGRGGMGVVYKARQARLNRFVALKILAPERQSDPQFAERFEREARALASLAHPNIVAVYDFGETQGNFYLLMEFVDGVTLRQLLQARKLSPAEALGIVPEICSALQYAHEQGLVHRDIKPENILIDKTGRVKIADFGIAKILDQPARDISLTGAKEVIGTAHYMAPEQLEHPQTVDCRADIYSVGVVFYEMLTGELPIGKFPPPSQKTPLDVRLDAVVLHALEKEPGLRYQKASDIKTAVEFIAATPDAPIPPMPTAPAPAPVVAAPRAGMSGVRKTAIALGALCVAALLLVAWAILSFVHGRREGGQGIQVEPQAQVSDAETNLLNPHQLLALQLINHKYEKYADARTFEGWQAQDRADLEKRTIDTLKGPQLSETQRNEHCEAINSLAAMRSTNALRLLRQIACQPAKKLLRTELANRERWMAIRAMGAIGDKTSVPALIPLLYHNNAYVRWSAQLALVRLTGQNFSNDWQAWGDWWNSQNIPPPYDPEIIQWFPAQPEPEVWTKALAEDDQKFFASNKEKPNDPQSH